MKYTFNILLTHLAWLVHVVTEMQVWSPDQPGGGAGAWRGGAGRDYRTADCITIAGSSLWSV